MKFATPISKLHYCTLPLFLILGNTSFAQSEYLTLNKAIEKGIAQYQSIASKRNFAQSSLQTAQNNKANLYLPSVIGGLQTDYGTVNSTYGTNTNFGSNNTMTISAAGPQYAYQNWDAAFGSTYLASVRWDALTFGRRKSSINAAFANARKDSADIKQEIFVHAVKITGAYLNLLTAQSLFKNAVDNLSRSETILNTVKAKASSGMTAGVDSSMALSEVSNARQMVISAREGVQTQQNLLSQYFNETGVTYSLDTTFLNKLPKEIGEKDSSVANNPQLNYYGLKTQQSQLQETAIKKSLMPTLTLFGIFQNRGTGFTYGYSPSVANSYTTNVFDGIKPYRSNYLTGLSFTWDFMSPLKVKHQVQAQQYLSQSYQNDYTLLYNQLSNQMILANQKIVNAIARNKEVPNELRAAEQAYLQKSVMYKNGLATIVDIQQAQYALLRAQTDMSVAHANIWEALLLKVAASGDLDLLTTQVD